MIVTVFFQDIKLEIIKQLNNATVEIKVAVAWLTDEDIIRTLSIKSKNGVIVQVAISNSKENFKKLSNLNNLIDSGGNLFISQEQKKFLHHKFCIIDNICIINGSYNWSYSAAKNEENILLINLNKDSTDDNRLLQKFNVKYKFLCDNCCEKITKLALQTRYENSLDGRLYLQNLDEKEILLRSEFEQDVKKSIEESKNRGIPISSEFMINKMALDGGGVEFVKRIIKDEKNSGEMKSGFQKLEQAMPPAIDLSFEYLVCKEKYQSLFTNEEIEFCRNLMRKYRL